MTDLAERKDSRSEQAFTPEDATSPSLVHAVPTHGELLPAAGHVRSASELLDPTRVAAVRRANENGQLKSNFWYEVSRIALWATTGLIALTVMSLASTIAVPFALPLAGAAVAASVLVASSQYSKRTFANRWFDVQDFQMQRQAALVGKSVEHAVAQAPELGGQTRWSDKFQRNGTANWAETARADTALTPEAGRA